MKILFLAAITLAVSLDGAPRARVNTNPYAGQPDMVAAGAKLFRQHCQSCHGAGARGVSNMPPLAMMPMVSAPDGVLFRFLTNGRLRRGMPSWSHLPDERRWQLVAYLKSLPVR